MADNKGTSSGFYMFEMDGVAAAEASEVSGIGLKHEVFKIGVGNQAYPYLGRSKYECNEVTVKHAHALNNAGKQMFQYFDDYINGVRTDKINIRLIQLGEDGFKTEATWQMEECVPTEFMQETNKGDSNDAAYVTFKFKPTRAFMA